MPTLAQTVAGFLAAKNYDAATVSRCAFWVEHLGDRELKDISPEEFDEALIILAERGRLKAGKNRKTVRTGKPLKASSFNRYVGQLGSVYRYAKRLRLLPRAYIPPTQGVEREPETLRHDRYFTPGEEERLIDVARLVDTRWGKLAAAIRVAFVTGLRRSNVLHLKWGDLDLAVGTATVGRTKNGQPQVSVLTPSAIEELHNLPGRKDPDAYVFAGRRGKPHDIRRIWEKTLTAAGISGKTFHSLRHGCGSALVNGGASQGQVMQIMGHCTLSASQRYMHASVADKAAVVRGVFE